MRWRRILADLKRRQVFKIAAFYGAAGFAVVQAADVFVPALRLPPAILTGVALVVILGFPVALVGVVLIGLSAWWLLSGRLGEGKSYESIAVLPLANLSGNADFDYFGDGLAEELLSALAGIENLRVAARTSAFAFEGRDVDVRTIGDSLGVETVLEGRDPVARRPIWP